MNFTQNWFSQHIPNWLEWLSHLQGKPCIACEIGSYEGRASIWLCDNILTHADSVLLCVDPFSYEGAPPGTRALLELSRVKKRFLSNTEALREEAKIIFYEQPSADFLKNTAKDAAFDLIYLDGNHETSAVFVDLALAWLALKPGGILICDDYEWTNAAKTPKPAIDAFLSAFEEQYTLLGKAYQVCVQKK